MEAGFGFPSADAGGVEAALALVCFDFTTSNTVFTIHRLDANIAARDLSNDRPGFKSGDFYPTFSVATAYETATQLETVAGLLGSSDQAEKFIRPDEELYFARGHLAPNSDFYFYSHQVGIRQIKISKIFFF